LEKNYDGLIPAMILGPEEKLLLVRIQRELSTYLSLLEVAKLRDGLRPIFNISRLGNQLMQSAQPWVLIKSSKEEDRIRAGTVIGLCANVICQLAVMLHPYMPASSAQLLGQLNVSGEDVNRLIPELVCRLPAGHKIGKAAPLFQKIEQAQIDVLKERYSGAQVGAAFTAPAAQVTKEEDSLESLGQKVTQQVVIFPIYN
jgi:methionyl-tRNA synthetase